MKWLEFCRVVYPDEMRKEESGRGAIWKMQRCMGIYGAYVFYSCGISANVVDLLRVLLVLSAFYFLSALRSGEKYTPIIGVCCMYFQVFLDFVDGAVARASGAKSLFGKEMDGLPNALARSIMILLFGILTRDIFFIILSAAASYILTGFISLTVERIPGTGAFKFIKLVYRRFLSVLFMLIFLPAVAVFLNLIEVPIATVSYVIVSIYILLSFMFLGICAFKK